MRVMCGQVQVKARKKQKTNMYLTKFKAMAVTCDVWAGASECKAGSDTRVSRASRIPRAYVE